MRRIATVLTTCLVTVLVLSGCTMGNESDHAAQMSAGQQQPDEGTADYLKAAAVQNETDTETSSAVDVALEWATKYRECSTQRDQLQRDSQQLLKEKQELKSELAQMKLKLAQAEQELTDANEMLIEMRTALEKWKLDVLGFRKEMRLAQKTELETLVKILRLIGGEVEVKLADTSSSNAPVQLSGKAPNVASK